MLSSNTTSCIKSLASECINLCVKRTTMNAIFSLCLIVLALNGQVWSVQSRVISSGDQIDGGGALGTCSANRGNATQVSKTHHSVGAYSFASRDNGGAIIYIQESSNNFVTVMVDDRSSSQDGGREPCPRIRGQGNNNLVLRIVVNGYACPLSASNQGASSSGAHGNNLIPDMSITYSSSVEIFISAGGNLPERSSNNNNNNRDYLLETYQSGLVDAYEEQDYDGHCPSIDVAMSTDVNIRLVVDNSRTLPPFRGINLSQRDGYRANLVINSSRRCRVPRINIVHCEHTIVQIHTKLSSRD